MTAIFTPKNYQQIYNANEGYIVGSPSQYSNFNIGSRIRVILEAFSLVSGQTQWAFYDGFLKAIPVTFYEGTGFTRKAGTKSGGDVEAGLTDPIASTTVFKANIQLQANGNGYETTLPFVIKTGNTTNDLIIPFVIDPANLSSAGSWNAATNTPPIPAASAGNKGVYYEVTTPGTPTGTGIPEIEIPWLIGEWVISNGTAWQKAAAGNIPILSLEIGEDKDLSIGDIDTQSGIGKILESDLDIDFFRNITAITGGTDQESNEDRRERFFVFINGLTRSNPNGILSAALNVDGVVSAALAENFPTNGWNTLSIDDGTASDNPALFAEIYKVINGDVNDPVNFLGYRGTGIQIDIRPPEKVDIDLTSILSISDATTENPSDIVNLANSAIQTYLNTLKFGADIILSEMYTAAQNSHEDIVDVEFTSILINSVPVSTTVQRITIEPTEVVKIASSVMTSILVGKHD